MNWRFWKNIKRPNWLRVPLPKTYVELKEQNAALKEACVKYAGLCKSLNQTLQFNASEAEKTINSIRTQSLVLLGGIALQHQGELLIKDEFMEMITNPEYRLQVNIERNEDNSGTLIRTVEQPHPDHVPQESEEQDKKNNVESQE
jgi:hypothetical protein